MHFDVELIFSFQAAIFARPKITNLEELLTDNCNRLVDNRDTCLFLSFDPEERYANIYFYVQPGRAKVVIFSFSQRAKMIQFFNGFQFNNFYTLIYRKILPFEEKQYDAPVYEENIFSHE